MVFKLSQIRNNNENYQAVAEGSGMHMSECSVEVRRGRVAVLPE